MSLGGCCKMYYIFYRRLKNSIKSSYRFTSRLKLIRLTNNIINTISFWLYILVYSFISTRLDDLKQLVRLAQRSTHMRWWWWWYYYAVFARGMRGIVFCAHAWPSSPRPPETAAGYLLPAVGHRGDLDGFLFFIYLFFFHTRSLSLANLDPRARTQHYTLYLCAYHKYCTL